MRALGRAQELPEAGDGTLILEPEPGGDRGVSSLVHTRRVKGRSLWICYRESGDEVDLIALLDALP
jgi:hypothetical protein